MRQDRTVEEEREKASERACVRLWKIDCGCNVVNVRRKDRSSDEKKKEEKGRAVVGRASIYTLVAWQPCTPAIYRRRALTRPTAATTQCLSG